MTSKSMKLLLGGKRVFLQLTADGANIIRVRFIDDFYALRGDKTPEEIAVISLAEKELAEYFKGTRQSFSVPYRADGTDFQKSVWQATCEIGCGKILSYEELAAKIGSPNASRAVGTALKLNPVLILIPCHRVVKKNGYAGHYAGGEDIKKRLLNLETEACAYIAPERNKAELAL